MRTTCYQRAFTLLEMAIAVLVIGVLLGSVMAGKHFLRVAELRAVMEQVSTVQHAVEEFRTKYEFLPGDYINATNIWGDNTAICPSAAADGDPGTCNGNGDEHIQQPAGNPNEAFLMWQHLSLAGLLEGSYSGRNVPATNGPGFNTPYLRLESAGARATFTVFYVGVAPAADALTTVMYPGEYNHVLFMGKMSGGRAIDKIITSEEAWHIDTKMDDQRPATGQITSFTPAHALTPDCATTATNTAIYKIIGKALECSLIIKTGF